MREESVKGSKIGGAIAAGLLSLIVGLRSCTRVPAGYVAVIDKLGHVYEKELEPGIHMKNPLSSAIDMSVRTQERKETMTVPTNQGMMATIDVAVQYHLIPTEADKFYKRFGVEEESQEIAIVSPLRNVARDVVASHSPEDLYNFNRGKISSEIEEQLRGIYKGNGIELERVLLRGVSLPKEVTAAIDRKIKAKQEAEQMEFTLMREEKESERKRIEAKGIADAQKIIAESLTPEYLQWRYITTLEALTNSDNTTFVITPYDQKMVPMLPLKK
ncbi:MAG: prohibitin family protein [Candidatus Schekmanbacteria bacterium]|nr:MAG: prohibitin family protein [Candidatus Schekmanbacteria bacterium]